MLLFNIDHKTLANRTFNKLVFICLLAGSISAQAINFNFGQINKGSRMAKEDAGCAFSKASVKAPSGLSEQEYFARAAKFKTQERYCSAYEHYLAARLNHPYSQVIQKAWIAEIESLYLASDYEMTISEAQSFMFERAGTAEVEVAHYFLLRAVADRMQELHGVHYLEWAQYGLGIHPAQKSGNSNTALLSFKSFVEKYPKSTYTDEVRSYATRARNILSHFILEEGKIALQNKDFPLALNKFNILVEQGITLPLFEEGKYYQFLTLLQMAEALKDRQQVSDQRLAEWLKLPAAPSGNLEALNKFSRDDLSAKTRQTSEKILREMIEKLPNSAWTLKAQQAYKKMSGY